MPSEPAFSNPRSGRSRRERQEPILARERRIARYDAVMERHRAGVGVRETARQLQISRTTVAKYVSVGSFPERKVRANPPTPLAPFAGYLERRWQEGCSDSVQLWEELREQGFTGGKSSVYRFTAPWRKLRRGTPRSSVPPLPPPRRVLWWLLGDPEKLTAEQFAFTHRLREGCPVVRAAVDHVEEFRRIVRERRGEALEPWVRATQASGITELQTFCRGIREDWEAVVAGITQPWSNGPTEGHVNRLKLIKRQMYGRAGFGLLRARVLGAT